jgi:single-stranded DNA-binding protein
MIGALVTGALFRAPEQKTSKTGRSYVSATLKVRDDDATQWVRVTAFSEGAQTALLRLADGDAIAVQGPLKIEIYKAADGETKLSLSIVTDQILAHKQPPKKREVKPDQQPDTRSRAERCAGTWRDELDGPNDSIPF